MLGEPRLSAASTPATVPGADPFFERLKWVLLLKLLRLTSTTTAMAPPASVFCCALLSAEPTTRSIVAVSVAVPPLSLEQLRRWERCSCCRDAVTEDGGVHEPMLQVIS
jgi:hypothetical protein